MTATKQQYRLTINSETHPISDAPPSNWSEIGFIADQKGWRVLLETRTVYTRWEWESDSLFLEGLRDPETGAISPGWMVLPNVIVSPWQYDACFDFQSEI